MRRTLPYFGFVLIALVWTGIACEGKQPIMPNRVISLALSVPESPEVKASLLTSSSNELLYRVDGQGMTTIEGTTGAFSSSSATGSINVTVDVPTGLSRLISLQLNDASNHQALAVGATLVDLPTLSSDVVVDMGSVTRNCYALNVPGGDSGETYGFMADSLAASLTSGGVMDIQLNYYAGLNYPLTLTTAQGAVGPIPDIAYLGNGNLVDFDFVPPATSFYNSSDLAKGAPVSLGDIFCISLNTGGHAWFQVTSFGNGTLYVGPVFRYRVNTVLPYYAYEQTTPDLLGACSTLW